MFTGKRWRAQLADLTQTMTHANELAMQMINDTAPDAFAYNANWASFELERGLNANMGFGLYDRQTVKRLIADTPTLLPPSRVDIPRDKRWNMQKITDQITQGIIQGEALDAVAKRLQTVAVMNFNSARTHARTAMTGAQNAGRIESYHRAEKMGIKVKKRWLCTLDNHTRHAHAALDGQVRDVDTPFDSELGQIMFPGDRDAAPANVYNCRCTLISVLPDYPAENAQRRDNETGELIEDMTFKEWREWKEWQKNSAGNGTSKLKNAIIKAVDTPLEKSKEIIDQHPNMSDGYKKVLYKRLENGSETAQSIFEKYVSADSVENGQSAKGVAFYSPTTQRITMNFGDDLHNVRGEGTTFFHEHGHLIDNLSTGKKYQYTSAKPEFIAALKDDWKVYRARYKAMGYNASDTYKLVSLELWKRPDTSINGVSDTIGGLTKKKCEGRWGHAKSYWDNQGDEGVAREAFAHLYAAMFNAEQRKAWEEFFPNACGVFDKMLESIK